MPCVSLMASRLICGQTNYYITVSQPVGFVTLTVAFDPPQLGCLMITVQYARYSRAIVSVHIKR